MILLNDSPNLNTGKSRLSQVYSCITVQIIWFIKNKKHQVKILQSTVVEVVN